MKKSILTLGILASGLCAGGPSLVRADRMGHMTAEEHAVWLQKKLDLNADQETKVRQVLDEEKTKVEEISKNADDQIRGLLSDPQKSKYDKIVADMEKEHMHHKMKHE